MKSIQTLKMSIARNHHGRTLYTPSLTFVKEAANDDEVLTLLRGFKGWANIRTRNEKKINNSCFSKAMSPGVDNALPKQT